MASATDVAPELHPVRMELRLSERQREALDAHAERHGQSLGASIRQALDELLTAGPGDPVADRVST